MGKHPTSKDQGIMKYLYCSKGWDSPKDSQIDVPENSTNVLIIPKPVEKGKTIVLDDGEGSEKSPDIVIKIESETSDSKSDSDLEILDASNPSVQESERKRKRSYELRRVFQEHWAVKLPWAEPHRGEDGRNSQARCIYCSKIEGRDLLLVAKIDALWKHAGRKKATKTMYIGKKKVMKGDVYFDPANAHVQNEKLYFARGQESVAEQVTTFSSMERKMKLVNFTVLFHVLSKGSPMLDYEQHFALCKQLKVPNLPTKHWNDNSGWDMAECMTRVVIEHHKKELKDAAIFSLSADEVTTIDNQSWLSIHCYVVKEWKRMPILLTLQRVVDGCTADKLTSLIVNSTLEIGGLSKKELAEKLVSFGGDGAAVFQGCNTGVIQQLKGSYAPYTMGIHCCAHMTNLAFEKLDKLAIVSRLEHLCNSLYAYFASSPKRHLEYQKLAGLTGTEGNKLLRNNKTRWISLLLPMQRVLAEYKTLIAKLGEDSSSGAGAKATLTLMLDLQTFFAFSCLMPLFQAMDKLIKIAQARDVFVSDFVAAIKDCQADLNLWYSNDSIEAFTGAEFQHFNDLIADQSSTIEQEWRADLNDGEEFLSFRILGQSYNMHWTPKNILERESVSHQAYHTIIAEVKVQCSQAAEVIINQLDEKFPNCELMDSFGIVFPQYWKSGKSLSTFPLHFAVLKKYFCEKKSLKENGEGNSSIDISQALNLELLESQMSLFKLTMKQNGPQILEEGPFDENPLTKLWIKLSKNPIFCDRICEWFKVAQIAIVTVVGSVEDERTFSTVAWMKNKVRNRLTDHLDTSVQMYAQRYWDIHTFPYQDAITLWKDSKGRVGTTL